MRKTKIRSFIVFLIFMILMLTACTNTQMPEGNKNNAGISGENEISSEADLNKEHTVDSNMEEINKVFYGKVKSIIGNEIEIEIGTVPDQTWDEEIDPEDKKKPHIPLVKIDEGEIDPDNYIVAPNPPEYGGSIFGEDGEINLTYTGESRTLIIPAGTDIRNTLGKKETLDSIKKGTVLMVTPKVIDGKDAGIEVVRILG